MKDLLKFKDFEVSQYKVAIDIAANGFIVRAGCKRFVCEDLDELMSELYAFFKGEFTDLSKQFKDQMHLMCPDAPKEALAARPTMEDEGCDGGGDDCG